MPTYADVVAGRLLLQAGSVTLEQVGAALQQQMLAGAGAPDLLDVLGRRGALAPEALQRLRQNAALVLLMERERLLARLFHMNGVVPGDELRALFAQVKQERLQEGLGEKLAARGLLAPERLAASYAQIDPVLDAARAQRVDELSQAVRTAAGGGGREALAAAFELCGVDQLPLVRMEAPPPPSPPPAAPNELPAGPGATGPTDVRPEDCPIYGYEIVQELGKGAMGVVYKARNIFTRELSALKILPLKLAARTIYLERFKREAMALMRIQHENVVRAYDFGGSEDYYYLALEFIEGETLEKVLAREGPLPEDRALDLTRQIARGLQAAWAQKVVHRDVKPENVMLTPQGVAKLCDFGIVRLADLEDGGITQAGTTVGTPFYISPEQAKGERELDVRSDLYSLGITLFHLASGQIPFDGESQGAILVRHILEEVPDPRTVRPELSEGLARIVARLTRKKRNKRYQTPAEAIADIDRILDPASAFGG